ncbi:MAG TPA: hypothetical protein VN282_10470 [Pyrinomonadaceae bacterium]|nr:hypothetical protein [Pyrinomonadaceae bacterium]
MSREDDSEMLGGLGALGEGAPRPFAPEQMLTCEECLRANAPTRFVCLYCGAALPRTKQSAADWRPSLKKLEEWEQGFNVVTLPRAAGALTSDAAEEAASLLRLDAGGLKEIVLAGRAMPVARTGSADEAWLIVERLRELGLSTEVFPDEVLARRPQRVRALEFEEAAVVCRAGPEAEPRRVAWSEVVLFVTGRVVSRRVEVAERKRGLGGGNETVETRELMSDEAVLDIYTSSVEEHEAHGAGGAGFRVMSNGFDYSCLGAAKRLVAAENFNALVSHLRERAPSAVHDREYEGLRPLLSDVWPSAERTESLGLRRERAGRFNTEAVTTVSNETQFTRYARLRQLLVLRARTQGT